MSSAKYPTWGSPYYRCSGSHRPPWEHSGSRLWEQLWKQPAAVLRSCMVCRAPPEHGDLRHPNGEFLFHLFIHPFLILTVLIFLVVAVADTTQSQNAQRNQQQTVIEVCGAVRIFVNSLPYAIVTV